MIIEEITTESAWQAFISKQDPNTFLQSWAWGQVQQKDGEHVLYLGFFENGIQVACALVVTVHARRGNHYLIPPGPILCHLAARLFRRRWRNLAEPVAYISPLPNTKAKT